MTSLNTLDESINQHMLQITHFKRLANLRTTDETEREEASETLQALEAELANLREEYGSTQEKNRLLREAHGNVTEATRERVLERVIELLGNHIANSLGKDVPLTARQQHTYGQLRTAYYSPAQRAF
ncbi:hypothetical protein JCM10207_005515 [Rhodosporidiobolus poonsookiae]